VLVVGAYLAPDTTGSGFEMDEGAVVAYGARVLDGDVPHRDFLTFYGPGSSWLVAGAFTVFGESVGTERAVGLAYRLVIVLALFLLGVRLAGLVGGALAAFVAAVSMGHELIWAYASYGALAFGLLGIALAAWAATARGRVQTIGLVAAGVAGAMAVVVRFDFALAVAVGALALFPLLSSRGRIAYGGGLLVAVVVYGVHAIVVGSERIARLASDLEASGPGRRLPLPDLTTYPGSLLSTAVLASVVFVVVGVVRWRRERTDVAAHVLVSVGVFSLALLPLTLSRADAPHIRPFALAPLSLLPALGLLLANGALSSRTAQRVGAAVVALATLGIVWMSEDVGPGRIRDANAARTAYRGFERDETRDSIRAVISRTRELSRPGESLFVGPQDLRRTNYGPTYMYFLLPELEPASYYMEMNPGTANREGSGLADELRRADWLILTSEWDDWNEPNDSTVNGPSEPNEVVRDDFCLRLEHGAYRLYERCDRA
jgi:hypothetical protein